MSIISLTTDFGDLYPAAMKAVILGINPNVRIIDVTHSVQQAGVREGAFALYSLVPYFPQGAVHIGVVDPGVGTSRRALAVIAGSAGKEQFFVGPDNGLLIPAARRLGEMEVYEITNPDLMLKAGISATFHGRDIFAPVGAHLSKDTSIEAVGQKVSDFVDLDFGNLGIDGPFIIGEVIFADGFGNIITNVPQEIIFKFCTFGSQVQVNGRRVSFVQTYGFVGQEQPLVLIGSHGFLEIAVNKGNAALQFGLQNGDQVAIKIM
ncbi:S-adenosyl-l-methionine hydroxide adenosyltransferase family protein [Methanosarcina sp. Z-7115]|uniref:S-adenosyl-l-methionine hydroxide adenosyltransferase family protein n=1 Tax=Methanosarcina baikalica TaxID=3073890 RepID=A0ABU2D415_9EURY|nr:S-adenosyl-l-methionine hydroxide adenosyltransferase family protein [Methanosarcina sp. Z-7115]MDR7666677.1 S-adenosyl-l-methionine hydroxide adenosyltransferase family protein [Methanosarcina sp. Z-7115]